MTAPFNLLAQTAILCAFRCILVSGCRGQPDLGQDAVEIGSTEPEVIQSSTSIAGDIGQARELLKAGAVDDAAARLAQMQIQKTAFDEAEARQFRQAYAEAYDRALEAIQRGDPRGEIALRLLRAAAPR
jgi:ParB-like chromosome segregation protein Spo0J